jgi:hypothetical protein
LMEVLMNEAPQWDQSSMDNCKCWIYHFQWVCCTNRPISQACWTGTTQFHHPNNSAYQLQSH